jgi:hypothetical protein
MGNEDLKEGWFKLGKKFGTLDYGKYNSGLLVIADKQEMQFKSASQDLKNRLNLTGSGSTLSCIYGRFFVTKKGKSAFEIGQKESSPHILIKDNWGGALSTYYGGQILQLKNLFKNRRSSSGGGLGVDFVIVYAHINRQLSIDDL